jgi:hypothetical protein
LPQIREAKRLYYRQELSLIASSLELENRQSDWEILAGLGLTRPLQYPRRVSEELFSLILAATHLSPIADIGNAIGRFAHKTGVFLSEHDPIAWVLEKKEELEKRLKKKHRLLLYLFKLVKNLALGELLTKTLEVFLFKGAAAGMPMTVVAAVIGLVADP